MAKRDDQTYNVSVSNPGVSYYEGTLIGFDEKTGDVKFRRKKHGSSAFEYVEMIPASRLVALTSSKDGVASITYLEDTSTSFSMDGISSIETLPNGLLLRGSTADGTTVVFSNKAFIQAEVRKDEGGEKKKAKVKKPEKAAKSDKKEKKKKSKENWDD